MHKRESGKKSRFERPSLMPMSERGRVESSTPAQASAAPRRSWAPEAIVRAKPLAEAGWDEVAHDSRAPEPRSSIPGSRPSSTHDAASLRAGMVPPAPPVPRISMAAQPSRASVPPTVAAPRASMGPEATRTSMKPGASASRLSSPPPGSSRDPWERLSLTPAVGTTGLGSGRHRPEDPAPEEERRYTQALFLREQGRTHDALILLDEVCKSAPEYVDARVLHLKLALELSAEDRVRWSADWALHHYGQRTQQHAQACWVYRTVRMTFPQFPWSEKALLAALISGDKAGEGRVVVDITKMLLTLYPQSPALPRALYASASVQHNEGRPDLARATLHNLITRFPLDPLAATARRKIGELG